MTKKTLIIFIMLMIAICCSSANALTTPSADITTYYTEDSTIDDSTSWIEYETNTVYLDDEINSIYSIELIEVSNDGEKARIEINDDEIAIIAVGSSYIYEEMKLKLTDLDNYDIESSTSSSVSETDDVVDVWIEPASNDKLFLAKNGGNSFDMVAYGSDSGWSTVYEDNEIEFKVERLEDVGIYFDMDTEDGSYIKDGISDDILTYIIQADGKYVFTVKYEKESEWGGTEDVEEVYTLTVTNLGEAATVSSDDEEDEEEGEELFGYTYTVTESRTKTVTTPVDGEFELAGGITINEKNTNSDGSVSWIFKMGDEIDTFELAFTADDSNDYGAVTFKVQEKVEATTTTTTTTTTPTTTTTANQSTTNYTKLGGYLFLAIGGIIAVKMVMDKKGGKKGGRSAGFNQMVDGGDNSGTGGL